MKPASLFRSLKSVGISAIASAFAVAALPAASYVESKLLWLKRPLVNKAAPAMLTLLAAIVAVVASRFILPTR